MTTLNAYATLAEFKAQKTIDTTDANDDAFIEGLLKSASRFIDAQTGFSFVPYVETRYFDVPRETSIDKRLIGVGLDLLEVLTVVNGDGVTIPSTEYSLRPRNKSPHYGIRLVDNSTYYWATDGAGDSHDVIAITGVWGYHNRYPQAWLLGSTANEELDASETGYTVSSGTLFAVGDLVRFDNEIGYVSAVATNDLTITRGENYSTATTHLTSINVYNWKVQEDIKQACLQLTNSVYQKRYGQNATGSATITAMGVVIRPEGMPSEVWNAIKPYRNIT